MRRSRPAVAAALALLGALAACGDDDPTPTAAGAGCETVAVEIGAFAFEPTPVEIGACDSVTWTNVHDQAHTATGEGDATFTTGNLQPGDSSEPVLFEEPGDVTYICALHPFMQGVVSVS